MIIGESVEQDLEKPPYDRYENQDADEFPEAKGYHPGKENANSVLYPRQDISNRASEKDNNDE